MMKSCNGLFLPLEVVKREYTGKMLLAVWMANCGMPVFIGHKSSVLKLASKAKDPGILFYKSARIKSNDFMDDLRDRGFSIVAQDEEAGIIYDDFSYFYKVRPSLQLIQDLQNYYCWGSDDYSFLVDKSNCPELIKKTGSARTSLWGDYGRVFFEEDINRIRSNYGNYILMVSNFASGNYILSKNMAEEHLSRYAGWKDRQKTRQIRSERDQRMINSFVVAAKEIVSNTGLKVIIRPHPSENVSSWEQKTKGIKGVVVRSDADITPWILASDCIIQNGCTSGIEAACSDVPTISFAIDETDLVEKSIPNMCSIRAIGTKQLIDVIRDINNLWQAESKKRNDILSRKMHNYGTLQPIFDIAENLISVSGSPNPQGNSKLGKDSHFYDLYEIFRMSKLRGKSKKVIFDQSKRPPLVPKRVYADVKKALRVLSLNSSLQVIRVAQNCFRISRVV